MGDRTKSCRVCAVRRMAKRMAVRIEALSALRGIDSGVAMSIIDGFIARYTKEYDFYDQAGNAAARLLEKYLLEEGIQAIVSSRAKSVLRLKDKCLQREKKNGAYESVEMIFEDIKDLAGVRVALYFPGERSQVEGIVKRSFYASDPKTKFEPTPNSLYSRKFTGYSAAHYIVQLREQDPGDQEKRYATARIEAWRSLASRTRALLTALSRLARSVSIPP